LRSIFQIYQYHIFHSFRTTTIFRSYHQNCLFDATTILVERLSANIQYVVMISSIFRIAGYIFGLVALYAMWLDFTMPRASIMLGELWSTHHLASLLISETFISRYVDPCGLVVSIGCEPFLWHPTVSTLLLWPAALALLLLMGLFCGIGRLLRRRSRRFGGHNLKRSGER
jgi:hypothetical protein